MATKVELERIQASIGRMGALAGRWQAGGEISGMERDLMLDKLRGLYEEVLFLDREEFSETAEALIMAGPAPESDLAAAVEPNPIPEPESIPEPTPEPLAETDRKESEGQTITDTVIEDTVVGESVVWEESEPEEVAVGPEKGSEIPEEKPFEEPVSADRPISEPISVPRNRTAQELIRTLYGDMPMPGGARQPQPEPEKAPEQDPVMKSDLFTGPAVSAAPPRAAVPENSNGTKVLGEVIGGQSQAFNEVLGQQHVHEDVASRLRAGSISDLRHSIGLNDRFLLIRELFAGDAAAYDEAIAVLDAFTDLDDAMIHIQEHFNWRPDAEATLLLVDLLERKLEQR